MFLFSYFGCGINFIDIADIYADDAILKRTGAGCIYPHPNTVSSYYYFYYGTFVLIGIIGLVKISAIVLLLKWKKLGFWMFLSVNVATVILIVLISELEYIGMTRTLTIICNLFGILILFTVLQIKENGVSCWEQLE